MIPKKRLLIADDQPMNIRMMAEALVDEYEVFFATSGAKALEIAAAGGIDLILLDVVMPEMDGFEVCRRLKANEATAPIPIIFVTALDESTDEARGFDAGAVDYITKPIRPPVVRARVRTHLELKAARDLLERLASIDPLTGIANRRRFDAVLTSEWRRAVRQSSWFSLAIVDVDHFKLFNDTYGHARGDDCLRAIGQAIAVTARRPADLGARYGGEEFAMIFPETGSDTMRALLRGLLENVQSLGIEHAHSPCEGRLTVSAGGVSLIASEATTAERILETADALLYEAKIGRHQAIHRDLTTGATERVVLVMESRP